MSAAGPTPSNPPRPARGPCSWVCPAPRPSECAPRVAVHQLGDAKVSNLGNAVGREEHVARLQIAMNDPGKMGGVHGSGNVSRSKAAARQRKHWSFDQQLGETASLGVFKASNTALP